MTVGTFYRYVMLDLMFLEPSTPFVTVYNDHFRVPLLPLHKKIWDTTPIPPPSPINQILYNFFNGSQH